MTAAVRRGNAKFTAGGVALGRPSPDGFSACGVIPGKLFHRGMNPILAALALLWVAVPAVAQVWKGEVPDAAKVAALQKAAAKGDPAAMADVAYLSRYCRGGVKHDRKLIYEYSRKSAKAGNAFGMSGLSYCYMQGCGVDADHKEAHRWAEKSADLKHPCGIFRLGVCYEQGYGVAIDRKRMLELYKAADEMGSVNARMGLLVAHYRGHGLKQDRDKALVIANELVSGRDWPFAAINIMTNYRREGAGDEAFESALACVSRHASLGLPDAMHFLVHYQRENGMLDDESFLHRIIAMSRQGELKSFGNLSAYVDHVEYPGYDLPVYATDGTYRDLIILSLARGLDIHCDSGNARRAILAYSNGGDACPQDLGAARAIAQKWVLAGPELTRDIPGFHMEMAGIYQIGVRDKVEGFDREDLAVAHAIHDCATCSDGMRLLQLFHRGFYPGFQRNIAKAYVTAKLAHEMKDGYTVRENIVKRIEVQLKEADWKEIKRLRDDGYPTASKFRKEARKLILASGFKLPEENPDAGPEAEDLQQ
jgi:hypothetical protein